VVALETVVCPLLLPSKTENPRQISPLSWFSNFDISPLNSAPPDVLLAWADQQPIDRYPRLAHEISLFEKHRNLEKLTWSPLALHILKYAPNRANILKIFALHFHPTSWSGSLADALTPYLYVVRELRDSTEADIADWARDQEITLSRKIEEERKRDRIGDESFE